MKEDKIMQQIFRQDVKDYFYGSVWADAAASIGTWFFILMGVFKSVNMYAVAVLWVAGCMIVKALVRAGKTCPNWQSYVISDMQQHQQRGIGLLGVDPEQIRLIDPINVTGPFLDCGNIVTIREQGAAKKFLNRLFQILPFAYGIYLLVNQQYYIPELIFRMDGENA